MSNEGFRIVVIAGVIISFFASRANKLIGGIVSSLVTTFILIFGLQAYSHSGAIAIFGIQLSQAVFIIVILVWYAIDFRQVAAGLKEKGSLKLIRDGAAEKLRSGHSVSEILTQTLPSLENHPQDIRQVGGQILQGWPLSQVLKDYQVRSGKDEDQAVLRYQQAVDLLNSLQLVIMSEASNLGLSVPAGSRSYFLPAVRMASARTFSFGKKFLKGELVYRYNGKWVSSPEELAAEAAQTSAASDIPVRSLFRMPNNPAWLVRKIDIKGGPLDLDAVANG